MKIKRITILAVGCLMTAIATIWSQQPVITNQPQACVIVAGANATFAVGVTGSTPLSYQWQKWDALWGVWETLAGCTNNPLCLTNVQPSDDTDYLVIVSNGVGSTPSDSAHLTVITRPVFSGITNYNPSVSINAKVQMEVSVSGPQLAIQWYGLGQPLPGQAGLSLTVPSAQSMHAGLYWVVATNLAGSVTSNPVRLDVDPTFTKITTGPLVTDTTASAWRPCFWADYDRDGDLDLLVITGDRNFIPLYRNNGDGSFTRILIPAFQGHTTCHGYYCTWGDYDNDGYPDLFAADFSAWFGLTGKNQLFHNNGDGSFTWMTSSVIGQDGLTCFMGAWVDFDRDGFLDLLAANGSWTGQARNTFYQNRAGSFVKLNNLLTSELAAFVQPAWIDADDEGWPDLFITEGLTNRLYRNLGNGNFGKVTGGPLLSDPGHYWFVSSFADYDNNGTWDVILTECSDSSTDWRPIALYRNQGGFNFKRMTVGDVGPLAAEALYAWSCGWGDYDNDGWLDLVVGNGMYESDRGRCVIYRNNGDGTFTKITTGSPVNDGGSSPWLQWVDYNRDGCLDLCVSPRDGSAPHRLYKNNGNTNAWLCVTCEGSASPRSGTGAKVRVKATIAGKTMWQQRLIDAGASAAGGASFVAHFGLGDATVADTLRIEWTSGIVQEFRNVPVKQYLNVTEPAKLTMTQPGVLRIQCWKGMTYRIDASPDLNNWMPLDTVTNPNISGGVQWTDPAVPGSQTRFYRVVRL